MKNTFKLIEYLYNELQVYIVPHNRISEKTGDTYITYKSISNEIDDLSTELSGVHIDNDNVYRKQNHQYQTNISFNVISNDLIKANELAVKLFDILSYSNKEDIYHKLNIVIVDVSDIKDVSFRLIDVNSYRFNIDVRFRSNRIRKTNVGSFNEGQIN